MTLNELVAVFAEDDLNPNAKLLFHIDDIEYVIDDIAGGSHIFIYLRKRNDS